MCGIAGIYLKRRDLSTSRFPVERMADELLLHIANRGRHATGLVAANRDGTVIHCQKDAVPAEYFVQLRDDLPRDTKTLLMHTRFATQGSANMNENNHPVQVGGTYVTHNGVVYNDNWLFSTELCNVERAAEVDSIVFPTMIDEWGWDKTLESLKLVTGSYAVACIQPAEHPDELILARGDSSPVHYFETDQALVWASEAWHLEQSWENSYGTAPSKMYSLLEGEVLIVKNDTVTRERYMDPPTYGVHSGYFPAKQSRKTWTEEPVAVRTGNPNRDCTECGQRLGVRAVEGNYETDTHLVRWRVFICLECYDGGKDNEDALLWGYVTEPVESWHTEKVPEQDATKPRNIGSIKGDSPHVDEFLALMPGQVIPEHLVPEAFGEADCEWCGEWTVYGLDDDGMPLCKSCYDSIYLLEAMEKCDSCEVFSSDLTLTMLGSLCHTCVSRASEVAPREDRAFDVCSRCDKVKRTTGLWYDGETPICTACDPAYDLDGGLARFLAMYQEFPEDLFETDESMKLVSDEYRMPPGMLTYVCYRADCGNDRNLMRTRQTILKSVELAVKARHTREEASA